MENRKKPLKLRKADRTRLIEDITSTMPATAIFGSLFIFLSASSALAQLPSQFDARDYGWITEVKNQSSLGTCWAFASTSQLETGYIRAGFGTAANTDFSEWQMSNYAHPQSHNEYASPYHSAESPSWGGELREAIYYAQAQFSSAFIAESAAPYPLQSVSQGDNLSPLIPAYVPPTLGSAVVSSYGFANTGRELSGTDSLSASDASLVKNKVLQYGSAWIGMTWSFASLNQNANGQLIYNNTDGSSDGGHATVIVGWDDSIDTGDGKAGAFIVKNSWDTDWGNDGYYYLAYGSYLGSANVAWTEVRDSSHLTSAYSTLPTLNGADEHYLTDRNLYSVTAASKIELDHSNSNDDTLLSLGIMTEVGQTYRLSLYDGDGVESIDDLSLMTLLHEEEKTFDSSGFQIFDLNQEVDVSDADNLWIVYENIAEGGSVYLYEFETNALSANLSYTFSGGSWQGASDSNTLAGVNFYMIPEPSTMLLFGIMGGGLIAVRRIFYI